MGVVGTVSSEGRRYELLDDQGRPVDLVNDFLRHCHDRGRAANTCRAYAYDLQYLLRFLEEKELLFTDFRPRHTIEFLTYLRSRGSRTARDRVGPRSGNSPRRLSDATVARVLASVSVFYEFLIVSELYLLEENPFTKVPNRKGLMLSDSNRPAMGNNSRQRPVRRRVGVSVPQRLPRPIPRADVVIFLASLNTLRDRAIFLLCVNGGLRPSEVLTLRLGNIRYGHRQIVIAAAVNDPRGLANKSRQERVVDIHDEATLRTLSDYVMNERPRDATVDLVFLVGRRGKRRGEPLSYWAVNRLFARRFKTLGLRTPWTTPHALRHTHATEMWEHGMREMTLQQRLGHATPAATRIYTRVSDRTVRDEYAAAVQALRDLESDQS